MPLAFFPLN